MNARTDDNKLEQSQDVHTDVALTKAIALMGTAGQTKLEMLWQLQEEANGKTVFQPKWDA